MTLSDKTGAPVTVRAEPDRFVVSVEGSDAGFTMFVDQGSQRVFYHTLVDEAFGGRGLATVLIGEALSQTRAAGLRIVPVCPMVNAFCTKHPEYADVVDHTTREIMDSIAALGDRDRSH